MQCPYDEAAGFEADRILAAAIYLMSCHARNRCPRLACMVERHLELLGRHPQVGEHVRHTCRQLAAAWEAVRAHDEHVLRERFATPPAAIH